MDVQPFDTIHEIIRRLSRVQSLLKGRTAPICHIGNRRVKGIFTHLIFLFEEALLAEIHNEKRRRLKAFPYPAITSLSTFLSLLGISCVVW